MGLCKFCFLLLSITFFSCSNLDECSYLKAKNTSSASNYADVITNIYISDNATNDNFVSIWSGKLYPGQSSKIEIKPGNFGVKITGNRYYTSGIEKNIEVSTGYRSPVRFANAWTVAVTYDGNGIYTTEED